MSLDWNNWSIGGRIIFVTSCVSVLSMFMPWMDIGIASQTGLSQGTVLLLGLYVYPVLMLLKKGPLNRLAGLACAVVAVVCSLVYIKSQTISFFGTSTNVAASGAYLFLIASGAFIVGVFKYQSSETSEKNADNTRLTEDSPSQPLPADVAQTVSSGEDKDKACSSCGTMVAITDAFCSECGHTTK